MDVFISCLDEFLGYLSLAVYYFSCRVLLMKLWWGASGGSNLRIRYMRVWTRRRDINRTLNIQRWGEKRVCVRCVHVRVGGGGDIERYRRADRNSLLSQTDAMLLRSVAGVTGLMVDVAWFISV